MWLRKSQPLPSLYFSSCDVLERRFQMNFENFLKGIFSKKEKQKCKKDYVLIKEKDTSRDNHVNYFYKN